MELQDGSPCAAVTFIALPESYDDLLDDAIGELWESDGDAELTDEDRERLFASLHAEAVAEVETLDLGVFFDFDRLFDVLSLAADHAEDWESQLLPFDDEDFDEPDVYDIFGRDDDDDEDEDDYEDDSEDDDPETVTAADPDPDADADDARGAGSRVITDSEEASADGVDGPTGIDPDDAIDNEDEV